MKNPFLLTAAQATGRTWLGHAILITVSDPRYRAEFERSLTKARETPDAAYDVRMVVNGEEFPLQAWADRLEQHWEVCVNRAVAERLAEAPFEISRRLADKLHELEAELNAVLTAEFPDYDPDY